MEGENGAKVIRKEESVLKEAKENLEIIGVTDIISIMIFLGGERLRKGEGNNRYDRDHDNIFFYKIGDVI